MSQITVLALTTRRWGMILMVQCLLAVCVPAAFAQDGSGCEGVNYSKKPFSQYSPEKLEARIRQNPTDVDALINLGIRLEEQGQTVEAKALYERAVKSKPNCYLGYYFGGLAAEKISSDSAADAEVKIHKAISLDPSLETDPNIEGYLKRHRAPMASAPPAAAEPPSFGKQVFGGSNRFYFGLAIGILLATLVFYAARSKRTAPTGA